MEAAAVAAAAAAAVVAVAAVTDGVSEEEGIVGTAEHVGVAAPSPGNPISLPPPPPPLPPLPPLPPPSARLDADAAPGTATSVSGEVRDKGDAPTWGVTDPVDESVVVAAPTGAVMVAVDELVVVTEAAAAAVALAALSAMFPPRPLPPGSVTGCSSAPALQMRQVNLLW